MLRRFTAKWEDRQRQRDGGFVGEIRAFALDPAGSVEPVPGWLYLNGATVAKETYRQLYDRLGGDASYPWGQAGANFTLPDYRGRALSFALDGQAAGGTRMSAAAGTPGGAATVALATAEIPAHVHDKGSMVVTNGGNHQHGAGFTVQAHDGNYAAGAEPSSSAGSGAGFPIFGALSTDGAHAHSSAEFSGASGDGSADGLSGAAHANTPPVVGTILCVRY